MSTLMVCWILALGTFSFPLLAQTAVPVLTPNSVNSADASPFEGDPFSMSAANLTEASKKIVPDKISNATILYEEVDYRFAADGKLTSTVRLIYRVETQAGIHNWGTTGLVWEPWFQNAPQIRACILQPNGSYSVLDQKTVTDSPINANEPETYTLARFRQAPLPGIQVGSIVEEELSLSDKRPYFADGTEHLVALAGSAPMEFEKVVVEAPSSVPFHDKISYAPHVTASRTTSDGILRVVYKNDHEPALASSDIDLASHDPRLPALRFSTGRSWQQVAQGYAALADPSIKPDQVRELLPQQRGPDRLQTIQALVATLHRQVRYTGVEFNQAEIVPQAPAEVLKRHYGDCKDKSNLLVSMLRAENIPAYLALLWAGPGPDIQPDLPGMKFNHAIVYVPANGKDPELWIDATAEYYKVGTLPYGDGDRYALIVRPETTDLTKTPASKPADSLLVETRTFKLADFGPAQVIEKSETHGDIDAVYRSWYGGSATKKFHEYLENYGRNVYLAKDLSDVEHGAADDMANPFHLTLTFDGARRGYTSLKDASVTIFPNATLNQLPTWFSDKPVPLPENATPEQKQVKARKEAQRDASYNIRPFTTEQRYQIEAPDGFLLRALPTNKTTALGPATLTESYSQLSPNRALVDFRFAINKSTISPAEALGMRDAVLSVNRRNPIVIDFEQSGVKLMVEGKIKDAIAADRAAIASNPRSALAHVWLANLFLDLKMQDEARAEAAKAVEIDPKSAPALYTQGWILQFGALGRRFGTGFDRAGAISAYQKDLALHSEDFDPRFNLAVLDEYDARGVRYSSDSNLADSIALYRSLVSDDKAKNSSELDQHRTNLAYALFFHRDFNDLQKLLAEMPHSSDKSALLIACTTAQNGAPAGVAAADRLNLDAEDRSHALTRAAGNLAGLGQYPEAATILSAGLQGNENASASARFIEEYRQLHRYPLASPAVTTPESAVFAFQNMSISGTMDRSGVASLWSRRGYADDAGLDRFVSQEIFRNGSFQAMSQERGNSKTLRDLILGAMNLRSTGTDATGYRIVENTLSGKAKHFFVVREDGTYRIVAFENNNFKVGFYALYALDRQQPELAKSILDWRRELTHRGGGDDPLSGPLLPRFWTVDSSRPGANSPDAMRVAAISLLAGSMEIKPYLKSIAALREKAEASHRVDFDLLLARGYTGSEQYSQAAPYIDNLLQEEPDSASAVNLKCYGYMFTGNAAAGLEFVNARLAKKPGDPDLLRTQAGLLAAERKYAAARQSVKSIMDSGRANAEDYNRYAWLGMFDNSLGSDVIQAGQQANLMTHNSNAANLQTLASIYAATGQTTEARQTLSQTISAARLTQPDSEIWLVLGLLYEDYGLKDAALNAYRNVKVSDWSYETSVDPESEYILSQRRIAALTGASSGKSNRAEARN